MDKFADDKAKLFDIAESIEEIQELLNRLNLDDFIKEVAVRDEVVYHMREIGIATGLLSIEFKDEYGDVDWEVLTSLQYASWDQELEIDPSSIWYIATRDLPRIKTQIMDVTTVLQDKEGGDTFFY